jgi:hypothetical protein
MERLQELLNRRPNRWGNLTIKEFERDIRLLQEAANINKDNEECTEWFLKIREDLDVDFPPGIAEYSITKPEGIYEMVMELKRMFNSTVDALREIDIHVRSTPKPQKHIVETLQKVLPEYR